MVTSEMAVCLCTPYSLEWWRTDQELPFVRSGVISSEESKLQNTQTTENVKVHKTATAIRARIRGSTNVMTVTLILQYLHRKKPTVRLAIGF